ncbi:MAG: NAD(P)/FAD-dependent oxidoreductase [Anaerolineales bacterium]|nr:NAD(P)/FAD-dependent oxidoreductase [Anaerolineales bacterium]
MNPTQKSSIAILGAGIGGMSAAYDLAQAGHRITIFEGADYTGGLAAGFKEPHWEWSVERFYHHWFASDAHMLGLIRELGWQDQVIYPRPYTVMFHRGKFYPFDSILAALLYPGLGWGIDKIRFGMVGLFLRLTSNWRALEKQTAHDWMLRWAGERVYKQMWEPLLIGKFGERYYRQVNMAWMWARIKARTTRLGTFKGGFQAFSDQLADHLRSLGVDIRLSTPVSSIQPAVVMVLALKHQLSEKGYYWYNIPKSAGYPFLALVEHTNFVSPEHFGGEHIVYIGDYLDTDHEFFQLSQEELLERFLPILPRFNPAFQRDWIRKAWLFRTPYAQPVPLVDHSKNIPAIQTPIPGLYFASMSQVYPWDRGTNFAVEIGRRAARLMLGSQP